MQTHQCMIAIMPWCLNSSWQWRYKRFFPPVGGIARATFVASTALAKTAQFWSLSFIDTYAPKLTVLVKYCEHCKYRMYLWSSLWLPLLTQSHCWLPEGRRGREGGRVGGREGGREGRREWGGREGRREGRKEGGNEGGRVGRKEEGGNEGGREGKYEGGRRRETGGCGGGVANMRSKVGEGRTLKNECS